VPQVDLALGLSPDTASVAVGQPFTFTWTITNLGPASVDNLLLTVRIRGISVVSQDLVPADNGCVYPWTSVFPPDAGSICDLNTALAAGASLSRSMTVKADSATPSQLMLSGTTSPDRSLGYAPYEPVTANNTASTTVTVLPPPPTPVTPSAKPGACANPLAGATARADTLKGTAFGDVITGLAGNDHISGLAGADCLQGGPGNDVISGGAGNDRLSGNAGADRLTGGPGKDKIDAGSGADVVNAADHSKDTINCGKGRDRATVDRNDRVRGCEKVKRRR
jgi:hypothetical protein